MPVSKNSEVYGKWLHLVLRIKKIRVKPYERNNKGNIWAMYKDNNKKLNMIENSSPLMSNLHDNFRLEI